MVLGFMQKFPWGEETKFWQKIIAGVKDPERPTTKAGNMFPYLPPKLHTIRAGGRWKPGMKIHMATGVRTKQYWQFNKEIPELQTVKSVQRIDIFIRPENYHPWGQAVAIFIDRKLKFCRYKYWREGFIKINLNEDGKGFYQFGVDWFKAFLQNDGLTEDQFYEYFKKPLRNGQLIHWTDLKY